MMMMKIPLHVQKGQTAPVERNLEEIPWLSIRHLMIRLAKKGSLLLSHLKM
jgi:hypothetical protein